MLTSSSESLLILTLVNELLGPPWSQEEVSLYVFNYQDAVSAVSVTTATHDLVHAMLVS